MWDFLNNVSENKKHFQNESKKELIKIVIKQAKSFFGKDFSSDYKLQFNNQISFEKPVSFSWRNISAPILV